MRIPLFVLLLLLKQALWSQQEELPVKDTIPSIQEVDLKIKDTLKTKNLTLLEEQKETPPEDENKKPPKKKRFIPYIKSMDEVTVSDYKIMYLDGTEKVVDTSLSLEGEYTFNFLREDYFEYLPLPNMGEGFNKLGYNFHDHAGRPLGWRELRRRL